MADFCITALDVTMKVLEVCAHQLGPRRPQNLGARGMACEEAVNPCPVWRRVRPQRSVHGECVPGNSSVTSLRQQVLCNFRENHTGKGKIEARIGARSGREAHRP